MKKTALILVFMIAIISLCTASFSDLSPSHWAYESVIYLTELGVISGMPDGTFKGNDPMTRYQTAVAMKRLLDFSASQTGDTSSIPSDLQSRLSELEGLVNRSLNAVQKAGEDYRIIMEKLEGTSIEPVNGDLDYDDLERFVGDVLEIELDSRNIEGTIKEVEQELENLKNENEKINNQLKMNEMNRKQTKNTLNDLEAKINTYRWVSFSSAVIAISSLIMAGYVLLK
ncbi:MAG: S-layer homology domain-containing protein [Thermotogota bacterium]